MSRAFLLTAPAFLVIGLAWSLTDTSAYLSEFPNWRGLPFVVAAVVVSMVAAIVSQGGFLERSGLTASLALSLGGFAAFVVGLIWFFTPHMSVSTAMSLISRSFGFEEPMSPSVAIEYPSSRGLPLLWLAAVLWLLNGWILQYPDLRNARVTLASGLLAAGIVALVFGSLLHPYTTIPSLVIWIGAVLVVWPYRKEAWLGHSG